MNLVLNVEAGAGTSKAAGATAVMQLASGGDAARMLEIGQTMSWPGDVRSGFEAHSSSGGTSFQSKWQFMLRAWGAGNGAAGEAESTNEYGAAKIETAVATGDGAPNQSIAPSPTTADAFAGMSTTVARRSPPPVTVLSLESTQPQCNGTASSGRPEASVRLVENHTQKPLRSQNPEASGRVSETRKAISKRQESAAENPVTVSPASSPVFAAPGETNLAAHFAAPAAIAIQAQAAPAESSAPPELRAEVDISARVDSSAALELRTGTVTSVPAESRIAMEAVPQTVSFRFAESSAAPEFRTDAVTSVPAASTTAPEIKSEDGSSDRMAQEEGSRSETAVPPAVPVMQAASQTETVRLSVSQRTAAPGRQTDSSLPDAPEPHMTASQSMPLGEKTSGTLSAASNRLARSGENAPVVSSRMTGSQQYDSAQHSIQPQRIEPSESREVRETSVQVENIPVANIQAANIQVANIQAASFKVANAPSSNSEAPRQVESGRSGFVEAPTANAASQWSLDSSGLAMGEAHNAAVPEARAGATNTSAKRSSAQTVNPTAVASGWAHAPESAQAAAITKPNAAGIGDRTQLPTAREPFSALDMGTGVSAPRWTHAGGHQAEAGFEDPALGWVGVRADLNGGSVHAALVPATAEAGQMLGAHMAGLNAYLADQHSPVAVLTLADSAVGAGTAGTEQHMQQGAGHNAEAGSSPHAETSQRSGNLAAADAPAQLAQMPAGVLDTGFPGEGWHGRNISVMA